ncbi:MAG: hypothetical protein IJB70_05015 [Clostridia bacterium]|nr:hypothetical protein [Clostridia bacterium]
MILKRVLTIILVISILGVIALVVTDPNIGLFKGDSSKKIEESHFFDGLSGFDYNYFDNFSSDSPDGDLEALLVQSWNNIEQSIDVSAFNITFDEFQNTYMQILNNNPLCYHVDSAVECKIDSENRVITVNPTYLEKNKDTIKSTVSEINSATDVILSLITDDMGDFEKVMTVHDYMVQNYEYDESKENHSITIMLSKTGVCESYARAFKHLMNTLGVDCKIVDSDDMAHSWNLVSVDGQWYHIDLTMDDPLEDKYTQVSHKYALLSTSAIESAEAPHYGFNLGEHSASSQKYDNASWRGCIGAIVCINKTNYWTDGNDLVSSDGDIIYAGLDGEDGRWDIDGRKYYPDICYTGLGVYDNILYFNTDEAIMSYNPSTEKISTVKSKSGICGIYVSNGVLYYAESPGDGAIEYGGEISL